MNWIWVNCATDRTADSSLHESSMSTFLVQSLHTNLHASAPKSALSMLLNTLCKINHTNRLWNENCERVVMFLYTSCSRINKYWACRPIWLCAWTMLLCAGSPQTTEQAERPWQVRLDQIKKFAPLSFGRLEEKNTCNFPECQSSLYGAAC